MRPGRLLTAVTGLIVVTLAGGMTAQTLTGYVTGVVMDNGGGVVTGATVTITNTATSGVRELLTGTDGRFAFVDLIAGTYDLTVALQGFKTIAQKGIVVAATERVPLRPIVLGVGGVEETVVVRREDQVVQSTTGARSNMITEVQIEDTSQKGRDFVGLLKLLPGVVDLNAREAPSWTILTGLSINGRSGGFNLSHDGIANNEAGPNAANHAAPALDSIAEVRIQSANFQAEYGRSSGASIIVITRSGSKDFHGSAAYYVRDKALNGNEYSRKEQCRGGDVEACKAPLYRFDNYAWTLGGPVLVPGTGFNRSRNRLFFFWSQDVLSRADPGILIQRRMPTVLERGGDFSQTVDSRGALVYVRDPALASLSCNSATGGPGCFPGNIIPAERINATAQAFLKLFPLPNASDPSGGNLYNYTFQPLQEWPRNDQVLRIDWSIAPRTTMYGRLQVGYEKRTGVANTFGFTGGWPRMASKFETRTVGYVNTLLHSFNATTFLEATAGVNWFYQDASPLNQEALDANNRSKVLPGLPQFFPEANPLDLLPNATFNGGVPGTIGLFQYERRFPFYGYSTLWDYSGSVTKIARAHTLKTGIFVEHTNRPVQQRSAFNGTFSFNVDGANPLNTNVGFANALLGAVTSYQKADRRPTGHGVFTNTEFYVQDNWRIRRTVTVDAGARFYLLSPVRNRDNQVAQFEPNRFSDAAAPLLFQPTATPNGRRAMNPSTGEILPQIFIGRPVPGSGDLFNGMQTYDGSPQQKTPFEIAPRAGFAWDVTGDGRTAVRGGAGAFYDRYADNDILELAEMPPLVHTYTTNYTTIPELLSTTPTETTSAVRRIQEFVSPVVYNWSLGLQRDVGWNAMVDVAYVGNAARRQLITRELNGQPYGYAYQPSSLDPTNLSAGKPPPLPDDLLRPYPGYASIAQREFTGYGDYHSLQVSATRRRAADGLSTGAAYTYEIVNKNLGAIDPFIADNRARNYNSAGRRPHTLTVHYSWLIPRLRGGPRLVRTVLEDWQLSGVTSLLSGAQSGFTYTYKGVPTGELSGNGSIGGGPNRPRIVCDPELARSQRTFERQFRTECIAAPDDPFHVGSARGDEFHGPGYVNWDLSAFKYVSLGGTRRLQFRVELYNAFNTYQWTAVNTTAEFDYATGALTNPAVFGRLTGATNSARRIQLAARLMF